jgi:hypothetical protein
MEYRKPHQPTTAELLKILGADILVLGAAAPVTATAEIPMAANVERVYIPQEEEYLPGDDSKILK